MTQGKKEGPREDQDGDPSHEFPYPDRGFSRPRRGLYKILGGMTSFHQRGLGLNLAYYYHKIVQSKNLWNQKGSLSTSSRGCKSPVENKKEEQKADHSIHCEH